MAGKYGNIGTKLKYKDIMKHIPCSTYRVQLNSDFKFSDAEKIVDYLAKLGVTDFYASPIFKASKGSKHGYDVVDPNIINREIGTEEEFESLVKKLHNNNIRWLQDIVPNHMAYNSENQMLIDLLENGEKSYYHGYFDIEWYSAFLGPSPRVLAPFLGEYYKEALESGKIKLTYDKNGFTANYYDTKLPVKLESYSDILSYRIDELKNRHGKNHPDVIKYMGILYVLKSLPDVENIDERYDQIKFIKSLIWEIYNENKNIKAFIDENLKIFNGESSESQSYKLLDDLLSVQNFKLVYWKVASEEINYRRFFNVNELISLKMENDETFSRMHSLIFKLIKEEKIDGLRIDHVDGLYDPTSYLSKLRSRFRDIYLVVEKILETDEMLPEFWEIDGTSGYDFLGRVNSFFCKSENEKIFSDIYAKFIGEKLNLNKIIIEKKKLIIQTRMAGDVERLAALVKEVSLNDRNGVDITMHALKKSLEEILAVFPVYRTYISKDRFNDQDKRYISETFSEVLKENKLLVNEIKYIENILLQNFPDYYTEEQKEKSLDLIQKFQQLTGPLMAKGFEDTTLYIYNRLISLNEVGGNPGKFGLAVEDFHNFLEKRNDKWPNSLNTLSTHDTKRGEDMRARLNVLSEIPDEWNAALLKWHEMNARFKNTSGNIPEENDEYFLYQTLIGSFPIDNNDLAEFKNRIKDYIIKAVREAKVHTAWLKPDDEYENGFTEFIDNILNQEKENKFLDDFITFQKKISFYGILNSLSQTLLNLTVPGIPDTYRGSELWNFSLVDPDNRGPVDYELRINMLEEIAATKKTDAAELVKKFKTNLESGQAKQFIIYKLLNERRELKKLFSEGKYLRLETGGKYSGNIFAFARRDDENIGITLAPRFFTDIYPEQNIEETDWEDTHVILPFENVKFKNIFTDEEYESSKKIFLKDVLRDFPVGYLRNE